MNFIFVSFYLFSNNFSEKGSKSLGRNIWNKVGRNEEKEIDLTGTVKYFIQHANLSAISAVYLPVGIKVTEG